MQIFQSEFAMKHAANKNGWRFSVSIPNDNSPELLKDVQLDARKSGKILVECLRAKDANGCISDYVLLFK